MGKKNKNNKNKNDISFLKKLRYWFTGFITSLAVLSSNTVTGFIGPGTDPQTIKEETNIHNKVYEMTENKEDLLTRAKQIILYAYTQENPSAPITIEDVEVKIMQGFSKENPFGVDFKKDEQGSKYALIVSSEGSEYGGYGSYLEIIINGEIYKGAKQNEFDNPNPAYFENEIIDAERIKNDRNNWLFKNNGEVYDIIAYLATAYKNMKNERGEVEKYRKKARRLLKKYYIKEKTIPSSTYGVTLEQLGKNVLRENNKFKITFPEGNAEYHEVNAGELDTKVNEAEHDSDDER